MTKIERTEPTDLTNGDWLDGNEYASDGVVDNVGTLELDTSETEGFRVSKEFDVGAISKTGSSKIEWTGDADVWAATSEMSARGSMGFDGVDDVVSNFGLAGLGGNGAKTISLWLYYPGPTGSNYGYFGLSDSVPAGTSINLFARASGVFLVRFRAGTWADIPGNFLPGWYHIVIAYATGARINEVEVYIDGSSVDLSYNSSAVINLANSDLRIGYSYDTDAFGLGNVYDFRLFDRKLLQEEITSLYNGGIITSSLVGHWPLDDNNSTARDISGNNNNGTIYGATFSPDNPLQQPATNGQPIPGISPGDDLTGKKVYVQQRFSRDTTGDPSPTLSSLTTQVRSAVGVPYEILTYGGWI